MIDLIERAKDIHNLRERLCPESHTSSNALLRLADMTRRYIQLLDSADDTGFPEALTELDMELRQILGVA